VSGGALGPPQFLRKTAVAEHAVLCFLDGHRHLLQLDQDALCRELGFGDVPLGCFVGTGLCNGVEELFESRPKLAAMTKRASGFTPRSSLSRCCLGPK
jgi:hypothetical protein